VGELGQRHPTEFTLEPMWHRALRREVADLFSGSTDLAQQHYIWAITAVVTLGRKAGPTNQSGELDIAERMGFQAVLNDIRHGMAMIRWSGNGVVELERLGSFYKVRACPLVVVVRS
jgi:hypothetical protein